MEIVVCIKQVPDVDDIKWTKENNLDRSQMLSKINQHDEWALDWAMHIKSKFKDVGVTVVTMGPPQAKEMLQYAIAKGADKAVLLSDRFFSGSDTIITAKILARAIKKAVPDFDLILTGHVAQDGDTAQVPVSLAQLLSIPDTVGVSEIHNADKNCAIVSQKFGVHTDIFEVTTPCLLGIKAPCRESNKPRIEDYIRAQNMAITEYDSFDLDFDKGDVGVLGSPTVVYRAFRPEINKQTIVINDDCSRTVLNFILGAR